MGHNIVDLLRSALVHYGYWVVAAALLLENAGVPVPGETVLLLARFLPYSERDLHLGWIIVVGTAAATLGGRGGVGGGVENVFGGYGSVNILFGRFGLGMRIIGGPLAGVLRMPWKKFAVFNLLGAALWVTVISYVGYSFGSRWNVLMHFM